MLKYAYMKDIFAYVCFEGYVRAEINPDMFNPEGFSTHFNGVNYVGGSPETAYTYVG